MANKLEIVVKGTDKASGVLSGVSGKLNKMGTQFTKMGLAATAAGAAIVGSLFAITKKTADAGDEVAKMAKRTNWGVESLSELRHVAEISGTSLDSFEKGTRRLSSAIVDARDGMETYQRAFEHLGLNWQELEGLTPEEQFWKVAYALSDLEDETLQASLAQDLFGRTGTALLPMLYEGADGIAELRQEAHDLGIVFDEESAAKAEEFTDAMTRVKASLSGAGQEIGEALMPILTDLMENKIVPIIEKIGDWIGKNQELVEGLLKFGGLLVAGGMILVGLGMVAKAIIAINAALILFHGLSGPAGWIKLAAGLALAGGAIAGMYALMNQGAKSTPTYNAQGELIPPTADDGGIYQGPGVVKIGNITEAMVPLSSGGLGNGETNVYVTVQGSVITEQELTEKMYEKLLQRKLRSVSLGLT